jgi:hypothetical protein
MWCGQRVQEMQGADAAHGCQHQHPLTFALLQEAHCASPGPPTLLHDSLLLVVLACAVLSCVRLEYG